MCSIDPNDDSKCLPVPDAPVYDVLAGVNLDHTTGLPCVNVGPSGARVMVSLSRYRDNTPPERDAWDVRIFDGQAILPFHSHPITAPRGTNNKEILSAALSFLLAAAEEYERHGDEGLTNPDSATTLFPVATVLWAHQMSDELAIAQMELEGNL